MNAGAKQSVFYGGIIKYAVSLLSVFLILFPFTFRLVYASSGNDAAEYVHTTIKSESNTVSHGQYVSFTVDYTVDHGKIKEGDYITVRIPETFKNHDIQLDPKHFKNYEKQVDGSYRLIFTNAVNGVAGSFTMNFVANNDTKKAKEETVEVNRERTTLTVSGQSDSSTGIGKAIEKTAYDGSTIQFGGYDHSTGDSSRDATEIGIYTPSVDRVAQFRIYVNNNHQNVKNVNVVDIIPTPDGVIYNNDLKLESVDGIKYTNNSEGNKIDIIFSELSSDQAPIITYSVTIKAGTKLKIDNRAIVNFTNDRGEKDTVIDSYRLKPGNGFSAADAYKSVDKTSISSDPTDQTVRYTITFDPNEEFNIGQLMIQDKLDKNIKFLYAYGDSSFETTYDEVNHVVKIQNVKKVDGSRKRTVTIVTDFSNVPEGADIINTVGNTVHTIKYKGSLILSAKKTVNNQTPRPDEVFKFQLTDQSGDVLQEIENGTDGSIQFESIRFKKEDLNKEHVYFVKEFSDVEGYKKDKTVYKVKVTPTDSDNDGIMEINPVITKSGDNPVTNMIFNNEYIPSEAKVNLEVTKKLTGRELKADEFEFTLTDQVGNVETAKNDANGKVKFKELTFDEVGTYTYTIKEVKAGTTENGITYDSKTVTAKVTVTDDGHGKLTAVVDYSSDGTANSTTFTNTYNPAKVKAPVSATKSFINKNTNTPMPLKGGEFVFALLNHEGDPVEKTTNDADGNIKFKDLEFEKAGTYQYTIYEHKAGQIENGITYSNKTVEVTIEVTDDGHGALKATVSYDNDERHFENTYKAANAKANLEVTKKLTGRELKADEFEFTLTDQDGHVKETVKNDKDGNVKFSELEFDKAGTYTYKIAEKAGTATGIQYDTKTITATVTVVDNGKGVLEVTVEKVSATELKATASKEAKDLVFTNKYTPAGATSVTLGAKKVLEGKDLETGKYSFELKKEDGSVVETVTNAADGSVTFSPISYDESQVGTHKYTISEVAGSETGITYDKTVQEVEVTVEKVSATELKATASKEAKDLVFTNKYTPAKTQVSVKKAWDDKDNQDGKRPSSVTVKLLADGQDTGKTLELNAANGWAGSFTDLDADKGGTPIQYTVVEVTVPGYTSEVTGDAASGFTITNSYSPETVDVKATKNWDDANNQDGKRPTKITINLLADGQKVASKEVQAAADGTWTATFEKLAKYKAGKEIKYTVTEEKVSEYESSITDFNITNKYTPKAIDYKVTKVWNDANNQDGKRPESVTVQLYKKVGDADPVAVEGKKLTLTADDKTDANTWVASFTKLPQYEAGKEITYSIKEVDVPAGYEASVTGQVVTNTHDVETVVLSGTKVWDDNNNQDGKRTDKVKVQILNGDKVVQEIEVSEATGWKFESKALPKYENGKEIKYTVKEVAVASYETTISDPKDGKYTITNTHSPEKITVSGQKTWIDNNDQDRIRPASITVALLADGKETGKTATATVETGWKYEFTELDRYQNGKPIEYTVKEVGVPTGYTATETGMNVTNTHTPEKTSVKGKKIWKGDENHTDARPPFITVKLLIDGKETDKVATASEATGWTYEFTGLDRYKDGQEIKYSVVEVPVKGYTSKVEDFNITNTYIPEKPTPDEPNEPGKPGQKPQLPNTGEKASNAAVVAGLALMAVTGGLYFVSRKNK